MKAIDLVSNATKAVAGVKDEANESHPGDDSGEHFAAIIGRAVAHRSPQHDIGAEDSDDDGGAEPLRDGREHTRQTASDGGAGNNTAITDVIPLVLPATTALPAAIQATAAPAGAAAGANGNSPVVQAVVADVASNTSDSSPAVGAPASDPAAPTNQALTQAADSQIKRDAAADKTSAPADAPAERGSLAKAIPIELLKSANAPNAPASAETEAKTGPPDAAMQKPLDSFAACGTSGAKQSSPMILARKTPENAEVAEQNLPAVAALSTGEELPHRAAHPVRLDTSMAASPSASTTTAAVETAPLMNNPLRTLERAEDLMALHGLRLRDSGNDSLQVVIKPGNGLHLSLNLQMRGGQVEMEAQLNGGDYNFLKHHWTELQQQLESRGVRLADLTSNTSSSGAESQFAQQQKRSRAEKQSTPQGAFAEFALPSTLIPKPALRALTRRGWESWA